MRYISIITLLFVAVACKPKSTEFEPNAGDVDPSRFVMVGGESTSGFMDDALYREGQENSLANIISKQLQLVGGGAFYQPFVELNSVGVNLNDLSRFKLDFKTDCKEVTSLSPVRVAAQGDISVWNDNLYNASQPFGNYGIPGFYMAYANSTAYSSQNKYFGRMASSSSASIMGDVMASDPTFFALFLGLEEVLDHARSGAKNESILTPSQFETLYVPILNQLVSAGAKGVVATLPDVTEMPFFTTIPYNGLNLDAESAETLNEIYNPIGIYFNVGANPFVIQDPDAGSFGVRQMQEGEMILLSVPLDSVKCYKMGSVFPFRNEFVLTQNEINEIRTNLAAYNELIISKAAEKGLALADVRQLYHSLVSGITYNGISMSAKFVSGGAYSLDGINLNPRGNAMLANIFIKSINEFYKARIPFANPISYRGNIFP
jgi:hypothetical protein